MHAKADADVEQIEIDSAGLRRNLLPSLRETVCYLMQAMVLGMASDQYRATISEDPYDQVYEATVLTQRRAQEFHILHCAEAVALRDAISELQMESQASIEHE